MTTAVLINHVGAYAAAVRKHLGDLSPEQVEDLTDGLEADLAEALDDPTRPITGEIPVATGASTSPSGDGPTQKLPRAAGPTSVLDLAARFGSPETYADELRSAAGLPAALPGGSGRRRRTPFDALRVRTDALVDGVVTHRRWPAVRDFLVSLRPVWWVARGWALFVVVASVFGIPFGIGPRGFFAFLLFVAAVVVSVQHGRGIWSPPERFAGVVRVLNVLAIVALPIAVTVLDGPDNGYVEETYVVEAMPVEDGVYLGGEPATNLFVYGPDGLPVDGARIVDDEMRPVVVGGPEGFHLPESDTPSGWQPREDAQGREVWNAYPLAVFSAEGEWDDVGRWSLPDGVTVEPPAPPVDRLTPLSSSTEEPVVPTEPAADPSAPVDPTVVPPAGSTPDPTVPPAPDSAAPATP